MKYWWAESSHYTYIILFIIESVKELAEGPSSSTLVWHVKDKRTRKVKKLAPSHSASTRWARLWPRPWNSKCLTPSIHHWDESIAESEFLGTDFTLTWFISQSSHPVAKHGPKVPVCGLTSDSDVGKELLIMLLPRKFPGGWGNPPRTLEHTRCLPSGPRGSEQSE